MNTKFSFLYRDAANYKVYNACILAGEITNAQIYKILGACEDGEFFIPEEVGLPGRTMVDEGFEFDPDLDNPMFEIAGEESFELTEDAPTIEMTVDQLVVNFVMREGRWQTELDYRRHTKSRPLCDWCGKKAVTAVYRTLYVDTEYEQTSKYFECRKCAKIPSAKLWQGGGLCGAK